MRLIQTACSCLTLSAAASGSQTLSSGRQADCRGSATVSGCPDGKQMSRLGALRSPVSAALRSLAPAAGGSSASRPGLPGSGNCAAWLSATPTSAPACGEPGAGGCERPAVGGGCLAELRYLGGPVLLPSPTPTPSLTSDHTAARALCSRGDPRSAAEAACEPHPSLCGGPALPRSLKRPKTCCVT